MKGGELGSARQVARPSLTTATSGVGSTAGGNGSGASQMVGYLKVAAAGVSLANVISGDGGGA